MLNQNNAAIAANASAQGASGTFYPAGAVDAGDAVFREFARLRRAISGARKAGWTVDLSLEDGVLSIAVHASEAYGVAP